MTQTAERTVPYEVWQREHELRLKAERDLDEVKRDRDKWKDEFYLQRDIRRAPVLQPVTKAVLEECRHVEQWGTVKAPDGSTRANFTTIADHLKTSPETVKRHAERLEKLGIIEIHEHQGPQDERDRKYVHVKEEQLTTIDKLKDPDNVVPPQGGNRYQCQNPACLSYNVALRTVKTLRCLDCKHEIQVDDSGWIMQNGHKAQKQLAFQQSKHAHEPQKQLAEHGVYTRAAIEDELRALPQWVVWRYDQDEQGKPTKVPYIARAARVPQKAKTNDPGTWATYDQAQALYEQSQREGWKKPYDGVGFVFNHNGIVGIDLDHCIDPDTGEMSQEAQAIIARLRTYAEISVSRTGLHLYAHGSLPKNVKRPGIELYDHARFFTWTARRLPGAPARMADCQAELDALYKELAPDVPKPALPNVQRVEHFTCSSSDKEILDKLLRDPKGRKLWNGDAGDYLKKNGTPDYSRADLALCEKLAYFGAGGHVSTIDRLFRESGLYREKWERDDYRMDTISKGIEMWQRKQVAA